MSLNPFLSHYLLSLWIFSPGFGLPASSLSEHEDLCTNSFKDWPVFPAVALKSDSTEKKIPLMLKIFSCSPWFCVFVAQFTSLLKGPHEHSLFLCLSPGRVLLKPDSCGLHAALRPLSSLLPPGWEWLILSSTHLIY